MKSQQKITTNSVQNEYSAAWDTVYKTLPDWKKRIVDDCVKSKREDRIYTEFVTKIIADAELVKT